MIWNVQREIWLRHVNTTCKITSIHLVVQVLHLQKQSNIVPQQESRICAVHCIGFLMLLSSFAVMLVYNVTKCIALMIDCQSFSTINAFDVLNLINLLAHCSTMCCGFVLNILWASLFVLHARPLFGVYNLKNWWVCEYQGMCPSGKLFINMPENSCFSDSPRKHSSRDLVSYQRAPYHLARTVSTCSIQRSWVMLSPYAAGEGTLDVFLRCLLQHPYVSLHQHHHHLPPRKDVVTLFKDSKVLESPLVTLDLGHGSSTTSWLYRVYRVL